MWVLMVLSMVSGGSHVSFQEFSTQPNCEIAAIQLHKLNADWINTTTSICVRK